jgi:hypothetical protein
VRKGAAASYRSLEYVTPDIQVIEPAGKRTTAAFLTGLRLQMRF